MLTVPRIRAGTRSASYESVYTLGGTEAFRLDTASWSQHVGADSDIYLPVLRIRDANGDVIAEPTGEGAFAPSPANPIGLSMSGPAVFTDTDTLTPPDAYSGYVLHDFGAVPITSTMDIVWNQPPGKTLAFGATWLRSAGAVVMGAQSAFGTSFESNSVRLRMTAGAAAGTYLLCMFNVITPADTIGNLPFTSVSVASNVAGNIWDTSGNTALNGLAASAQATDGWWYTSFPLFYRIVNPLAAGDTVTWTFAGPDVFRIDAAANVVTGLTVGNPYGPVAGGNVTSIVGGDTTTPAVVNAPVIVGTPKWIRGVIVWGTYSTDTQAVSDVMLERGDVAALGGGSVPLLPLHGYTQVGRPEIHLGPGCSLSALAVNSGGHARVTDVVSDFFVWALDD